MTEPRSGAQSLIPGAAGKEYTVNDIVSRLAALAVGSATAQQAAPPSVLVDGDVYIVGVGATGAWVGQDNKIAHYRVATGWDFIAPQNGYKLSLKSLAGKDLYWNGGAWIGIGLGYQPQTSAIVPVANIPLTLATELLPLDLDQSSIPMTWDPLLKSFEVADTGVVNIAYRFEFEGVATIPNLGTALVYVKRNATNLYFLGEVEVVPTAPTKQLVNGSVQFIVNPTDIVSFEINTYNNIASLDLVGGGRSWMQAVIG